VLASKKNRDDVLERYIQDVTTVAPYSAAGASLRGAAMTAKRLIARGMTLIGQFAREDLYLASGVDRSRPFQISGMVTERCNYRCAYCNHWGRKAYTDEMSLAEWVSALESLRDFVGTYTIQFVGGEPFVWPDFTKLIRYCGTRNIGWGVITNGSALNEKNIQIVTAANPINIDISIDGTSTASHDIPRGIVGSWKKLSASASRLVEVRAQRKKRFAIRIKPTIHRHNFRMLKELVSWTMDIGATSIDFSPVRVETEKDFEDLWISRSDWEDLDSAVDELIDLKAKGARIETSDAKLQSIKKHFRREAVSHGLAQCRVGMRNYAIETDGTVRMCTFYPSIGNTRKNTAREIWFGEVATALRAKTIVCDKYKTISCATSCMAHRNLLQEVQRGVLFLGELCKSPTYKV
jgi:MoaA/NifB/PqqE/SkfB family radical SAM enzyme